MFIPPAPQCAQETKSWQILYKSQNIILRSNNSTLTKYNLDYNPLYTAFKVSKFIFIINDCIFVIILFWPFKIYIETLEKQKSLQYFILFVTMYFTHFTSRDTKALKIITIEVIKGH